MAGRRLERVAEAIREVVSSAILMQMKDPRVQGVTVLRVEVTGDLRHAKVFVSLMGDARQQKLTLHGLEHARGFLQSKIAERLQTRWTPVIHFVVDESVKKSIEISRLIDQALAKPPAAGAETDPPAAGAPGAAED
jgi:ribosome-binding factor A